MDEFAEAARAVEAEGPDEPRVIVVDEGVREDAP
jgi:hypothetical protein